MSRVFITGSADGLGRMEQPHDLLLSTTLNAYLQARCG